MSNGTVESRSVNQDDWGEAQPGPLNGRIGLELPELPVSFVRPQPDVALRTECAMLAGEGFEFERLHYFGRAPGLRKNLLAAARTRE